MQRIGQCPRTYKHVRHKPFYACNMDLIGGTCNAKNGTKIIRGRNVQAIISTCTHRNKPRKIDRRKVARSRRKIANTRNCPRNIYPRKTCLHTQIRACICANNHLKRHSISWTGFKIVRIIRQTRLRSPLHIHRGRYANSITARTTIHYNHLHVSDDRTNEHAISILLHPNGKHPILHQSGRKIHLSRLRRKKKIIDRRSGNGINGIVGRAKINRRSQRLHRIYEFVHQRIAINFKGYMIVGCGYSSTKIGYTCFEKIRRIVARSRLIVQGSF